MRHSCVRERVFNSASERLRWEAAQTWTAPQVPEWDVEPAQHSIHMDQPPLAIPRLRREWLHPAQEAFVESNSDLSDLHARSNSSPPPGEVK